MSNTIRSSGSSSRARRTSDLGPGGGVRRLVTAGLGDGVDYFSELIVPTCLTSWLRTDLVDGVAPAIMEPVAVEDATSRQSEPRDALREHGALTRRRSADPHQVGRLLRSTTSAGRGVPERRRRGGAGAPGWRQSWPSWPGSGAGGRGRDIVSSRERHRTGRPYGIPGRAGAARPGRRGEVHPDLDPRRSDGGAAPTGELIRRLEPGLPGLGLEVDPVKPTALRGAMDAQGNVFMSLFRRSARSRS